MPRLNNDIRNQAIGMLNAGMSATVVSRNFGCTRKTIGFYGDDSVSQEPLPTVLKVDVFLMIRRKKVTIFTDAKESTTVLDVKKIVEGILKQKPEDQKLYKDDQPLDDNKTLGDSGFTSATARAQAPATIGLAFRQDDGEYEALEITPLSSPPELPDVMKPQDSPSTHVQEQAAS